uniref:Putative AP endonuclease family 2 n=1 Tax=uncultured marine microorganism HF4000_APKG7H23 TaxID=455551 RepID=B3T9U7_9ZZZZ|nr:putative AP endonuclease family 2 [uncultured marine microorganism HF4000_APKG7H23]
MRLGAHVSAAGGIDLAIDRGVEIGAEAVQIFASSNQQWAFKPLDEKQTASFKTKALEHSIGPNVLHGIYLVTLGTEEPELLRRGVQSLVNYMNAAHDLGMLGVVFHLGSHKGAGFEAVFRQVVESMNRVLDNSPDDTLLIMENSAGMGNHIGSKFHELGTLLKEVGSPRVKVCLDTQHSFAAGYDLTTPEAVAGTLRQFDGEIGLEHLAAIHCNDSKRDLGAGVDRHENIGEGYMGLEAFEAILAAPALRDVPFYLEVPGFEGHGPDRRNMDIIKSIREKQAISA